MPASVSVPGLPTGTPLWITLVALFFIVLLRSHGTYWLARLVSRGTEAALLKDRHHWSRRMRGWLEAESTKRAIATLGRWGAPAVTVCYLTIGFQTAIMLAAGIIQMPYLRFTIASIPGSMAWAAVWGTVGLSVFWAGVALAAQSVWALVAAVVLIGAVIAVVVTRRRARRPHPHD
ncbi:membrane protein DedA, SNARE-associated domain [Micrococcales bacterium KH10]|nr:membrane protein DedA, SNARE-associated domain [Micrococcales bacterium KH10]